jgi:WD40 repeat protein
VYQLEEIDSNTIASASKDRTVRIWNISSGVTISIFTSTKRVYAVKLLTSGYLAIGFEAPNPNNLKIINYTSSSLITNLVGHMSSVFGLEILNSTYLASASADKNIMIWDLNGWGSLKYTLGGHTDNVMGLKLLSSTLLASGSYDSDIKIWDWTGGFLVRSLKGHTNFIWLSLDIFSENVLISGSLDSTIKFWNITSGSLIQTLASSIQISTLTMLKSCKSKKK